MKKLFPEKRSISKKILDFLDRKGFYLVLILCIVVVGAAAAFVASRNIISSNQGYDIDKIIPDELEDGNVHLSDVEIVPADESPIDVPAVLPEQGADTSPNKDADVNAEKNEAEKSGQKTQVAQSNEKTAANQAKPAANQKTASNAESGKAKESAGNKAGDKAENKAETKQQSFIMPVTGSVISVFAQDRLIYSKTLEEWRTHSGIDLAADRGTPVKVVADGFVSEIKDDPRFGVTVIVEHENGIKTLYANLASDEMVTPNLKLKQGDIIGCVGNTALFESAEQPHLHFEVLKDNKPVDPGAYLSLAKSEEL